MAVSSRGSSLLLSRLGNASTICSRCLGLSRAATVRRYSIAAPEVTASPELPSPSPPPPAKAARKARAGSCRAVFPAGDYGLESGVILSRPPLLTRPLTAFEEAFFFYQRRLDARTTLNFVQAAWFRKNTPAAMDWAVKIRARDFFLSRDLGPFSRGGSEPWTDELLVGDPPFETADLRRQLAHDAVPLFNADAERIAPEKVAKPKLPQSRLTDADRSGDQTSLDRKLDRTLFLVLRDHTGWRFPSGLVSPYENLLTTAQRVLDQAAGVNMNTWFVGKAPIAHVITPPTYDDAGMRTQMGRKMFYLKARILAGQANLRANPNDYQEFRWLTSEELQALFKPYYFEGIRLSMPQR